MTSREIYKEILEIDVYLSLFDFKGSPNFITIKIDDGGLFKINSALPLLYKKYFIVFCEHFFPLVIHQEEIDSFEYKIGKKIKKKFSQILKLEKFKTKSTNASLVYKIIKNLTKVKDKTC